MADLNAMSLVDLRKMAKDLGISGCSTKKKGELIEILEQYSAKEEVTKTEAASQEQSSNKPVETKRESSETAPRVETNVARTEVTVPRAETSVPRTETVAPRAEASAPRTERVSERTDRSGSYPNQGQTIVRRVVGNPSRYSTQDNRRGNDAQNNRDNRISGYAQQGRNNEERAQRDSYNRDNSYTRDNGNQQSYSRDNSYTRDNSYGRDNNSQQSYGRDNNNQQGYGRDNTQQRDSYRDNMGAHTAEDRSGARYGSMGSTGPDANSLDSGISKSGILEIAPEQSFGFIRNENYLPSPDDIYVSPAIIKKYNLTTGDIICGNLKVKSPAEKFVALLYVTKINGERPELSMQRKRFEKLTPIFPHERLRLETEGGPTSVRIVDLLSPIGKGQRGMIVSPPKAGKTTLLKDIAHAMQKNNPKLHMIILLIDERPEEVTDMKECIKGDNVEIIYSTFDESPEQHKRVSEMTVEHAKRLVEYGKDVVILLDSITRLARAYNLTCQSSGRTLSGGLDPAALFMPKRFFGAARCMKEGGSLTILATALVDTGSRMDDVVFEEFKGTGNMELTLNRALSERRVFPAIDLTKSSTRRDDLLLSPVEQEANFIMRRAFGGARAEEATEQIVGMFTHTRSNAEFITQLKRTKLFN